MQVFRFIRNLLKGDLGISYRYRVNASISSIIVSKMGISMKVGLISMAVSLPLGMILGVLMARSKGKFVDTLGNAYVLLINALPAAVYFLAIQLYLSTLLRVVILWSA